MQLVTISWIRNEEDIVEDFVRHHAAVADRMIIMENNSSDATLTILRSLQAEGLPIDLFFNTNRTHSQSNALTKMMHHAWMSYNPDWILPLDTDEFLVSDTETRPAIEALSTDRVHLLPWHTYIPTVQDDQTEKKVLKRIGNRRNRESPQFYKVLIPRMFQTSFFHIPLGSHTLESANGVSTATPSEHLALAHFPVRSPAQISRKITENWERMRNRPDRRPGEGFHWELLYDEMRKGPPTRERLFEIASSYAAPESPTCEIVFDPIVHPLQ